jgi:hypothetical protein
VISSSTENDDVVELKLNAGVAFKVAAVETVAVPKLNGFLTRVICLNSLTTVRTPPPEPSRNVLTAEKKPPSSCTGSVP